jgi:hypothetical protein
MKLIKRRKNQTLYMVLQGGLGNQLFIYFAAKYIEKKYNRKVVFISYLPDRLSEVGIRSENIKYVMPKYCFASLNIILNKLSFFKITNKFIYFCENIGYENLDNKIFRLKFLNGYFQTSYYIENCDILVSIINDIKSHFEANCVLNFNYIYNNAIALHIRRGDYLLEKNNYFGLLSYEYYFNSLNKICCLGNFDKLYLFSDSKINYEFKDRLKSDFKNLEIIDTNEQNIDDICTLALLSRFSSHIISNSTFSWWGAFLGYRNQIVLTPSIWFKKHLDPNRLYPETWEMIESAWE